MGVKLPAGKNPYSEDSPFSILGVDHTATSEKLRQIYDDLLEDVNYREFPDEASRLEERKKIKDAYEAVKKPADRAKLSMLIFDSTVGKAQCRILAENRQTVTFDYNRILEGTDEIVPGSPDLKDVDRFYREPSLSLSTRVKTEGHDLTSDAEKEMMKFITFER